MKHTIISADKCFNCGHKMTARRENVPFLGLPGTTLLDVNVSRCPACGDYEVKIPMLDDLNRGLAFEVTKKTGRLNGAEIRFLRKVLDYSSADFARLLGASPVTISRWEHDVQPMGPLADALLRLFVEAAFVKGFDRSRVEQLVRAAGPAPTRKIGGQPRGMKFATKKWKLTKLRALGKSPSVAK